VQGLRPCRGALRAAYLLAGTDLGLRHLESDLKAQEVQEPGFLPGASGCPPALIKFPLSLKGEGERGQGVLRAAWKKSLLSCSPASAASSAWFEKPRLICYNLTSGRKPMKEVIVPSHQFRREVEAESGERVFSCVQCGKCSGGCPVFPLMDLGPRRLMRAVQLGLQEEALGSDTLWYCLSCMACSSRCPVKIDVARVIETLRQRAIREGRAPALGDIALFHRLFLAQVEGRGRAFELGLGGTFALRSGHPFAHLGTFMGMLSRGRLPLLPERAPDTHPIFEAVKKKKETAGG